MAFAERAGEESAPPQVPRSQAGSAHVLGVARHQAIGNDAETEVVRGPAGQVEVDDVIGVGEEDRLAVDAALGQMARGAAASPAAI